MGVGEAVGALVGGRLVAGIAVDVGAAEGVELGCIGRMGDREGVGAGVVVTGPVAEATGTTCGAGAGPQLLRPQKAASSTRSRGSVRHFMCSFPVQDNLEEITKDETGQVLVFSVSGGDDFLDIITELGQ